MCVRESDLGWKSVHLFHLSNSWWNRRLFWHYMSEPVVDTMSSCGTMSCSDELDCELFFVALPRLLFCSIYCFRLSHECVIRLFFTSALLMPTFFVYVKNCHIIKSTSARFDVFYRFASMFTPLVFVVYVYPSLCYEASSLQLLSQSVDLVRKFQQPFRIVRRMPAGWKSYNCCIKIKKSYIRREAGIKTERQEHSPSPCYGCSWAWRWLLYVKLTAAQ